jgi:hypothetical protein
MIRIHKIALPTLMLSVLGRAEGKERHWDNQITGQ